MHEVPYLNKYDQMINWFVRKYYLKVTKLLSNIQAGMMILRTKNITTYNFLNMITRLWKKNPNKTKTYLS